MARVLHLNTEPTWRGGEQQVAYLLDGLRARGWPVWIAAQPGAPMAERAAAAGHEVLEWRSRGEADVGAIQALRRWIRELGIEVVHAHTSHAHTLGALAAATVRPRPVMVVARRVDFSIYRRSFFGLNGLKYRFGVDRYVTVSEAIRQVLIGDGLDPRRITTVHSGIDVERIRRTEPRDRALREELGIPRDHVWVGNVAHMADHKGQRYLIEAAPRVLEVCPRVTFSIVGDGELREDLEGRAKALGVEEAFRFPGFRRDVPALLKAMDLFVMPSHMEGLGTSVLDAMAAEAPVVGTEAGGIPEAVVHGETGRVVPVRDPERLAREIVRLIVDPQEARRLAVRASTWVRERFSTDAMVEGTVAVYRELLGAR